MVLAFKSLISVAAAAAFGLPFDLADGPPSQLPPLSRYQPPSFPDSLRATRVTDGYAKMMFTVDAQGRVEDAIALEASHPAFVEAVQEALFQWRFKSAESATVPRREVIQFDFKRTGAVASLSQSEASKGFFPASQLEARPVRTVSWDELQALPQRLASAVPVYPPAYRKQRRQGHAAVSFVIDATGRVRVPVVTGASGPEFGQAALQAVRQWRFERPLQEGAAVHVLAEQSFSFGAQPR